MNEKNPALIAARNSWRCVQGGLKEEWLALMADDIVIEDPIGVSPLDRKGLGHQGKEAVSRFWDRNIGPNTLHIETHASYTGGTCEAAHVMTLTTTFPTGQRASIKGIFTYKTDDAGKITALRGYWEMTDIQLASAPEA